MKFRFVFSCFLLLTAATASTANAACSTNYTLRTQEQVDAFVGDGCTAIPGNLRIRDNGNATAISNLDALSAVTSVGGYLYLDRNPELTDISGLSNIGSVGSYVRVRNNDKLENLNDLGGIGSIPGYLRIDGNDLLSSIAGLSNLSSVTSFVRIQNNDALTDLTGLDNLSSVGSYLRIDGNAILENLDGLSSLDTIGGYLRLDNNPLLASVSGLQSVTTYGSYIRVFNNDELTSLSGLALPSTTSGYVLIRNNDKLADISSLASVNNIGGYLALRNNDSLVALTGLENLQTVDGYLQVRDNNLLNDTSALSAITSVTSNIQLINNDALTSLGGFGLLTNVPNNLQISGNALLTDVAGLSALTSTGGYVRLDSNRRLTDLTGLSSLTSVEGQFRIRNNDDLTSLLGLESLIRVVGNVDIDRSALLSDCSSLIPLVDSYDDGSSGPGPNVGGTVGVDAAPDVGGLISFDRNVASCNSISAVTGSGVAPAFSQVLDPNTISLSGTITQSRVTFTIDNTASNIRATELGFSDTLPAGISLATPANATDNCGPDGVLTAVDGGSSINFSTGRVEALTSCAISADVVGTAEGLHTNTTSVLSFTVGTSAAASADLRVDDTPPVISVLGDNPLNLLTGDVFNDPGATANDDIDGSVPVNSSDDVNTALPGNYTVTYTASDAVGNQSMDTRSVVVTLRPAPALSLSTDTLDFMQVGVGESSAELMVTLTNSGSAILSVDAIPEASLPFARTGGDCATVAFDLASGDSCTLSYSFSPDATGPASQTLDITSNAADSPASLTLEGEGIAAAALVLSVDQLDFMQVAVGESSDPQEVTLTNTGATVLQVTDIDEPNSPFILSGGSCATAPFDLAAMASCTLSYQFAPDSSGAAAQSIVQITSNSADSPASLSLDGEGVEPVRSFTGPLPSGNTGTVSFTSVDPLCSFAGDPRFTSGEGISPPAPERFELHDGLVQFEIENCSPGASVDVQMEYGTPINPEQRYWKVGDPWREIPATITANIVRFTLTDGGPNDDDGIVNGRIVDPSGAGGVVASTPTPPPEKVPVAPIWMLILLSLGLTVIGRRSLIRAS